MMNMSKDLMSIVMDYRKLDRELWDSIFYGSMIGDRTVEEQLQSTAEIFKRIQRDKNIDKILNG